MFGRGCVEVELDGGRVGELFRDGDEDCLHGIHPLEFSEEVDVETGIVGALGLEDGGALCRWLRVSQESDEESEQAYKFGDGFEKIQLLRG